MNLIDMLGMVHESKLKSNPSKTVEKDELKSPALTPPAPPARHMDGPDNVLQQRRVTYSNVTEQLESSAAKQQRTSPMRGHYKQEPQMSSSKKGIHSISRDEISALSSPTMSLGQEEGSPYVAAPNSPLREVPLHKAHTHSSSIKAANVPISTLAVLPPHSTSGARGNGSGVASEKIVETDHHTARSSESETDRKLRMLYAESNTWTHR